MHASQGLTYRFSFVVALSSFLPVGNLAYHLRVCPLHELNCLVSNLHFDLIIVCLTQHRVDRFSRWRTFTLFITWWCFWAGSWCTTTLFFEKIIEISVWGSLATSWHSSFSFRNLDVRRQQSFVINECAVVLLLNFFMLESFENSIVDLLVCVACHVFNLIS